MREGKLQPLKIKQFKNKFVDDLTEETEDLKVIGTQYRKSPTPKPSKKVFYQCRICKKIYSKIEDYIKNNMCNNCIIKKAKKKGKKYAR